MPILSSGLSYFDLQFLGRPHAIATALVQAPGSIALVDPGPTSCLPVLERELVQAGVWLGDVTDILLTHIHLDHAGATGTLLQRHPGIRVHVHERGAPHMVDPSKLLSSATRLYGSEMDRLWGAVAAVPEGNLMVLRGSEQIRVGGREFIVAYTPGHASHHVSYFDASSGVAFVGDTAGVSVEGRYILPPTPPPDIDLELWRDSIARIRRWGPSTLFLTHFGPVSAVTAHLDELERNMETVAAMVEATLHQPGTSEERLAQFVGALRLELRRQMPEGEALAYEAATPLDLMWLGLERYFRKRAERAS